MTGARDDGPALSPRSVWTAYLFARVGFGINLALHGWSRIPRFGEFLAKTQTEFAGTILPPGWVSFMCYIIVALESVAGPLVILGLGTQFALGADAVLLWMLIFGTCLVQNWSAAGDQLIYVLFCAGLYALTNYNRYSLDYKISRRAIPAL